MKVHHLKKTNYTTHINTEENSLPALEHSHVLKKEQVVHVHVS